MADKTIADLIKETKNASAEALKQEKIELGKQSSLLSELKKGIEDQGGKAEDNLKFKKLNSKNLK